jgi:hypothetical protein
LKKALTVVAALLTALFVAWMQGRDEQSTPSATSSAAAVSAAQPSSAPSRSAGQPSTATIAAPALAAAKSTQQQDHVATVDLMRARVPELDALLQEDDKDVEEETRLRGALTKALEGTEANVASDCAQTFCRLVIDKPKTGCVVEENTMSSRYVRLMLAVVGLLCASGASADYLTPTVGHRQSARCKRRYRA